MPITKCLLSHDIVMLLYLHVMYKPFFCCMRNYYKLRSLKQHTVFIHSFHESGVQPSWVHCSGSQQVCTQSVRQAVFSTEGTAREGSLSNLPNVVGRIYYISLYIASSKLTAKYRHTHTEKERKGRQRRLSGVLLLDSFRLSIKSPLGQAHPR